MPKGRKVVEVQFTYRGHIEDARAVLFYDTETGEYQIDRVHWNKFEVVREEGKPQEQRSLERAVIETLRAFGVLVRETAEVEFVADI